jgi:hypothetical protein
MTEAYGPKVARGKFERCSLGYLMMTCCLVVQRCALLQVVHNWTVATTHSAPDIRAPLLLIRSLRLEAVQTLSRLRTSTG